MVRNLPPLALIAGATASGKSALALALAERAEGTIINADSAQVYADLRILTARPGREEEGRVPHRLYGYRDGARACSAAEWAADAKREIEAAREAGRLPILVGGTGLYIRTLVEGIAPVPQIDPGIRARVRRMEVGESHAELEKADPEAAARLRPSDRARIARALETALSTGRSILYWRRRKVGGLAGKVDITPLILLPPRDWLYARCDLRFEAMMAEGGIAEVEALLARDLDPDLPAMRAIGVPEIAAFLAGETSREEALAAGKAATRRYAKRQYTWFSRQAPAEWPVWRAPIESGKDARRALKELT
ncbi:MAG: tRNA (adenosine(37)-N6)-dimethylallyltransferase MiaA [Sphingomonadaceae bacterium]